MLTIQQMFEAARQLGLVGNWDGWFWMHEQILLHQDATERDKFMVKVFFTDQRRRRGEAREALKDLLALASLELHLQAQDLVPSIRTKTVLCVPILFCLLKLDMCEHPDFWEAETFYEQNKGELQTPDLLYVDLEFQHVAHELGLK